METEKEKRCVQFRIWNRIANQLPIWDRDSCTFFYSRSEDIRLRTAGWKLYQYIYLYQEKGNTNLVEDWNAKKPNVWWNKWIKLLGVWIEFVLDWCFDWHHRLQVLSQGPIEISAYSLKWISYNVFVLSQFFLGKNTYFWNKVPFQTDRVTHPFELEHSFVWTILVS